MNGGTGIAGGLTPETVGVAVVPWQTGGRYRSVCPASDESAAGDAGAGATTSKATSAMTLARIDIAAPQIEAFDITGR